MSLTLGLSSALSGLLTSQQSLNVISQNITNVNTPGYDREVVNLNPLTLNGIGAGVTLGPTTRAVDAALSKSLNTQATTLGQLNALQTYYSQIDNLFGQVSNSDSIASNISALGDSLQQLSTQPDQAAQQSSTVQAAQTVTNQLNGMSQSLQAMRLSADGQLSSDVTQVNSDLTNLYTLNQQIVRNTAIGASTSDLQDQRDNTLTDLSKYMSIQYYQNGDGSTVVYTAGGQALLDSQAHLLTHAATTATTAIDTAAGGQFNTITVGNSSTDITSSLATGGGEMGALIQMRDTTVPNIQAQIDEVTAQLKSTINQISNRGTSLPNITNSYTGTAVFATQGTLTPSSGDTTSVLTPATGTAITDTTGGPTNAGYGSLTFGYSTNGGQMTIQGVPTNNSSLSTLRTPGTVFTVAGSANAGNDATYTVLGYDATSNTLTVSKPNPVQTFSISGGDVMVQLFDSNGNQINNVGNPTIPTVANIMNTNYSATDSGPYAAAQGGAGTSWSIAAFSAHMQDYLQEQGYSGATVGLNTKGQMSINLGSTAQATLAFRDQTSGTAGASAGDVTVNFDANGDGTPDTTTQGFSNFFGLNDVLVTNQPNSVLDSQIQPSNFATVSQRSLTLSDAMGQVGSPITIKAGSSLQAIAAAINTATTTSQSAELGGSELPLALTTAGTITISNSSGPILSTALSPGQSYTLQQIATQLTQGPVVASVEYNGSNQVLCVRDTAGVPISVSCSGGEIGGSSQITLGSQLDMQTTQRVVAEVVPEGSGQRLRLVQQNGQAIYASATKDALGKSVLTDLGLGVSAAGTSGVIAVNGNLQTNPSAISRGAVQWNADTQQYYLSEGDNTTALQMANAMTSQYQMNAAGSIAAGSYTFAGAAATTISLESTASSNNTQQQQYQTTLNNSLSAQATSVSGVNIDEEVTNMMAYQQAYSASARVISVLQEMMNTLTDLVR